MSAVNHGGDELLSFLTGATATWALWKLYDAWIEGAATWSGTCAAAGGQALDPTSLAVALQDLDELETPPAQALRNIADTVRRNPQRFAEALAEQLEPLSPEQRAAVGIALVMAARRVG